MIVEYSMIYNLNTGEVFLREFDRDTGRIRDLPLVVRDGRIYAEDDNGER